MQPVTDHLRPLCRLTDPTSEKLWTVFCGTLKNHSNENNSFQTHLIHMGAGNVTTVNFLGIHCQNAALTEMCLHALGNLAELESSKEKFTSTNIAEELGNYF